MQEETEKMQLTSQNANIKKIIAIRNIKIQAKAKNEVRNKNCMK